MNNGREISPYISEGSGLKQAWLGYVVRIASNLPLHQ